MHSPGQIYLADQRGMIETTAFRRYATFNYQEYFDMHRRPFGRLLVFNDEILAPKKCIGINISTSCYLMIMPITGELIIESSRFEKHTVDVGEVKIIRVNAGEHITIRNPFEIYNINFICAQFALADNSYPDYNDHHQFHLESQQNALLPLLHDDSLPFSINIGRFGGRKDALYRLQNTGSNLFAFVISGAFELQGRLLHERDGLALWDTNEVDLEALSNGAVILLFEMRA